MAQATDQIAAILHRAFKVAHGGLRDVTAIIGASQPSSDLRSELFASLARLKGRHAQQDLYDFHAKLQIAQSVGILDENAINEIYNLLEEV